MSVAGVHRLSASASVAGSGTARVLKWCLFQDDVPVVNGVSSSSSVGWRSASVLYSRWVGSGCWESEYGSSATSA